MRWIVLATLLSCSCLTAQFDTDGPNAALTVQGENPTAHDPSFHDFFVGVPGTLSLRVSSGGNSNQPIVLLTSPTNPTTGGVVTVPWGGSLDLGTPAFPFPTDISVVGDGLGFTTNPLWDALFVTDGGSGGMPPAFRFDAGLHPMWVGLQLALQAIVRDPTMPPFFLDNTDTASVHPAVTQTVMATTGYDGYQQVPFLPGFSFDFHGVTYTDVWVHANGFVTFGAPTSLPSGGATVDNVAAVHAEPAIFAGKADWDPTASSSCGTYSGPGGILVTQVGPRFSVEWGGVAAPFGGGISHSLQFDASDFAVQLELDDGQGGNPRSGEFRLDMYHLDALPSFWEWLGLVGHTPGGAALTGGAYDQLLRTGSRSSNAGEAQIEEHYRLSGFDPTLGWDGAGSPRGYNLYIANWNQAAVVFTPNATTGAAGSTGYTSQSVGPLPLDDLQYFDSTTIVNVAGGQVLDFHGSFLGFDPAGTGAGTVVFDPMGALGGPYPATVLGILDNSGLSGPLSIAHPAPGPHRDGQALRVLVPPLGGAGNYTVQVNFASGKTLIVPVYGTVTGSQMHSATLPDDGEVSVGLIQPVSLYGLTWNTVHMNANGFVTFWSGTPSPMESMALFFDGTVSGAANPMVAVWFSDLNPGGLASGATYDVIEDFVNGSVTCAFNNQIHKASNAPAGSFSCTFHPAGFNPGSVLLDYTGFLPGPNPGDGGIIGVSDGDASTTAYGTETDLTNGLGTGLSSMQGVYASPGLRDSIGESVPAGVTPPFAGGLLIFQDLGGGRFLIL